MPLNLLASTFLSTALLTGVAVPDAQTPQTLEIPAMTAEEAAERTVGTSRDIDESVTIGAPDEYIEGDIDMSIPTPVEGLDGDNGIDADFEMNVDMSEHDAVTLPMPIPDVDSDNHVLDPKVQHLNHGIGVMDEQEGVQPISIYGLAQNNLNTSFYHHNRLDFNQFGSTLYNYFKIR